MGQIKYSLLNWFRGLKCHICREGCLTHSFFPVRELSGVWLRLGGRRLAVPKDPKCGPPPFSPKSRLFEGGKNPWRGCPNRSKRACLPKSRPRIPIYMRPGTYSREGFKNICAPGRVGGRVLNIYAPRDGLLYPILYIFIYIFWGFGA